MIFWTLNARKDGSEAGEWALLDYLGRPSERVASIREISSFSAAIAGAESIMPEAPVTVLAITIAMQNAAKTFLLIFPHQRYITAVSFL